MTTGSDDTVDGISLVSEPSRAFLNERQLVDYRSQRRKCLEWLLALGKAPDEGKGYAHGTVEPRSRRMDKFYRWVWDREGGYTAEITPDLGDAWLRALAKEDTSRAHKANCQKAAQMLLKWRRHERGGEDWEPAIRFSSGNGTTAPRDYLTDEERVAVREAALEYGTVPHYKSLTPEDRGRWRAYLAQRLDKPKSEASPSDGDRANGWKYPSLVWPSLDAGLRPIVVERSIVRGSTPTVACSASRGTSPRRTVTTGG